MTLRVVVDRVLAAVDGAEVTVDVLECGHELADRDGREAYRRDCRVCSEEVKTLPLWR